MYKYFNPIITMERSYNWEESYRIYTSMREVELASMERLLQFAADSPDGQAHIDFIQSYKSIFQTHIDYVKSVIESMELQSKELLEILNDSDGVEGILALGYFWNVEIDTLYFFKPLEFDDYLKSQAYMIIEVASTPSGYKVQQRSLGFTTQDINEIRNEPSFIKKQIEKFNAIDNIEDIYSHKDFCENLLVKLFGVQDYNELFRIRNSTAAKLLGNPIEFLREIRNISNFMIIKMSFPQRLNDNLNTDIQELIEVEVQINTKDDIKELFNEENYAKYCESLYSRKTELMNSLSFQQTQLEEYISYLPKELTS